MHINSENRPSALCCAMCMFRLQLPGHVCMLKELSLVAFLLRVTPCVHACTRDD